jgi:hypothetical protein
LRHRWLSACTLGRSATAIGRRRGMTRRVSVETVRVGIELERGAVVDTEGQGFDDTRRHPVAACTTSSCSRESHLIQVGRVTTRGRQHGMLDPCCVLLHRATNRSLRPAPESPEAAALRGTTTLRPTTLTGARVFRVPTRLEQGKCGVMIISRTNHVVKQSLRVCQSSLHLDNI